MRPSHGDYRPAERRRYVPSGPPRRKIPVIRVALLLALGAFVFLRFDAYWPRVRQALSPSSLWQLSPKNAAARDSGQGAKQSAVKWSADSSMLVLDCPRGISGACCEALDRASPNLCGEARSLIARATWKGRVGKRTGSGFLRLEARAPVDQPVRRFALSGLAGRDERGGFVLRRRGNAGSWCEAIRGCLDGRPVPVSPLSDAKLEPGEGAAIWVSASPWVRATLPGRVSDVDSTEGGVIVRLYHGYELYTVYGPLRAVSGVRPGVIVKAGSHLGDAPARGAVHALAVRVRQAGLAVDPSSFWGTRLTAAAIGGEAEDPRAVP